MYSALIYSYVRHCYPKPFVVVIVRYNHEFNYGCKRSRTTGCHHRKSVDNGENVRDKKCLNIRHIVYRRHHQLCAFFDARHYVGTSVINILLLTNDIFSFWFTNVFELFDSTRDNCFQFVR